MSKDVRDDLLRRVRCVGAGEEAWLEVSGRTLLCAELPYAFCGLVGDTGDCLVAVGVCLDEA